MPADPTAHRSQLDEIKAVEKIVQDEITARKIVYKEIVPLATATSINGLRHVFGESYPDPVRVVSVGQPISEMVKVRECAGLPAAVAGAPPPTSRPAWLTDHWPDQDPSNAKWTTGSVEFCGGTHLDNIGEAGIFRVITEEGIAKGVRRIVSFTSDRAKKAEADGLAFLQEAKEAQKETGAKLSEAFKKLQNSLPNLVTTAVLKEAIVKEIKNVSDLELKEKRETEKKAAESSGKAGTDVARDAKEKGAKFVVHSFDFPADVRANTH